MNRFAKDARELALEQVVGRVLQTGVATAAIVVLAGAVMLLASHGGAPNVRTFASEPASLRSLAGIARGVAALDPYAVVQLGLVLLIATPVVRVILTLVGFAMQRDRLYVTLTAVVLAVLLWSIAGW